MLFQEYLEALAVVRVTCSPNFLRIPNTSEAQGQTPKTAGKEGVTGTGRHLILATRITASLSRPCT